MSLNVYEERILRIMRRYYNEMTVYEIADESEISWTTANKWLAKLKKKGLVQIINLGTTKYWRAVRKNLEI